MDMGINFVDVSPYYGLTKAETVLGKAVKQVQRDQLILATKVGRYGENTFNFSAERITKSVDESLSRLQTDYIDIIQCHDIEFVSLKQIIEESIPALRKLQQCGKVRFVGITGLPLKIFPAVMDQIEIDTILSYCHYTLNDNTLSTLVEYFKMKDVGIINASPFSMGLLTSRGAPDWHPAPDEIKQACAKAADFCNSHNTCIEKLALQYSLANPSIHTTLVGTSKSQNIKQNIQWMNEEIDNSLLQSVLEILHPIINQTWYSGLLENN
jgi:aryl-alcohol dehydrogenase-like predicted oxidoreductase